MTDSICHQKCNWYCQYQLSAINAILKKINFLVENTNFKCSYRIYIENNMIDNLKRTENNEVMSHDSLKIFSKNLS